MEILTILMLVMIVSAVIAVETRNLLSAIICLGAVGFLLSIAFLLLGAPDIAITQLVVDILVLVILIRATINRDLTAVSGDREFLGMTVTTVMVLLVAVIGVTAFAAFPAFGGAVMDRIGDAPSTGYLARCLTDTGAPNAVTAILLDFRAYDTLGEATVLFCAVLGTLAVLRTTARRRAGEAESEGEEE
jgi:multicomponent Na+:H+ antiporter subunit B